LFAIALVLLFSQMGGRADTADPLTYGGGFLVTGDYVVGSVDLDDNVNPPDASGLATGILHITGIPADADIVSASLIWESITNTADPSQAQAKFRGTTLDLSDGVAVKKFHEDLTANVATCWTSGQPVTMWRFRADVLRLLPVRMDKDNRPTTKRVVNDDDLTAQGLPLHTVSLPTRAGNQLPDSAGAALVIVYRDPTKPLRKIVYYDGIHIQDSLTDTMTRRCEVSTSRRRSNRLA